VKNIIIVIKNAKIVIKIRKDLLSFKETLKYSFNLFNKRKIAIVYKVIGIIEYFVRKVEK
jgi:hypothetical protein